MKIRTSLERFNRYKEIFSTYNLTEEEINEKIKMLQFEGTENSNNLEYDLRTTSWIIEKVVKSEDYSKKLYGALCNTTWSKNGKLWSSSFRHSAGIIADMLEKGDYLDWYCSALEGYVDPEIENDLNKLGWYLSDND